MSGAARVEWLRVGGSPAPWERIGLVVVDGFVPLFGTGICIDDGSPPGIGSWTLSGVEGMVTEIDGLPTDVVEPVAPMLVTHSLGAYALDHVVITTSSLDHTCVAIAAVTGAPLKRVRELGEMRQGFHRVGGLVVEVVERVGLAAGSASFWGLVLNVEVVEAAVRQLGPELVGAATPAVQPGRSIATFRDAAGLGLPVALMSPP